MVLGTGMAMLGSAAISGGAGILGNMLNKSEDPEYGYDVVEMPQYPWAEGTQQQSNQFIMDMMNKIKRGEMPDYMKYMDPMQEGMQQDLQGKFYGSAGRPGVLRDIQGAGAGMGVGPGGTMSKTGQAFADYMTEGRKIDEYFSSMKGQEMSRLSTQLPQMAFNAPRGPESQIVNMMGGVGGGQQQGYDYGQAAANVPWENMFQQQQVTPQQYSTGADWSNNPSQYGGYYNQNIQDVGNRMGYNTSPTWKPGG